MEAPGGGTIPPALCVTRLKPDIVIVDTHTKTLHIYELTMPMMTNIDIRHNEKTNKYSHFLTDISGYKCTLNCFEVASIGFVSTRNQKTLHNLHSFMRKDLKRSVFMNNLNSLAWYGSYQVWLSREEPTFTSPSYLVPHIGDLPKWFPSLPSHLHLLHIDYIHLWFLFSWIHDMSWASTVSVLTHYLVTNDYGQPV